MDGELLVGRSFAGKGLVVALALAWLHAMTGPLAFGQTSQSVTSTQAVTQPAETESAATQETETQPATAPTTQPAAIPGTQPATAPSTQAYDTTVARPLLPRDWQERLALERGIDFRLIDKLLDARTEPPPFERKPPGTLPADAVIAEGVEVLDDRDPFPEPTPVPPKEPSIWLGALRSTYHTREKNEVLSALQPLVDLVQREVNVRTEPRLFDTAEEGYFALADGKVQMMISNIFDYLLLRSWFSHLENNGVIPLAWAQPANPRTTAVDENFEGVAGTSVELIVAAESRFKSFADLRGARLSLTANYVNAPGTFLTQLMMEAGLPLNQPFFSQVTLRRYTKDALIDVYKGKADVTCMDQVTIAAVYAFYGIEPQLRTLAVSPRYDVDALYTSANNLATNQTEIELTQSQIITFGKNQEGQEILYLFGTREWHPYREGDFKIPEQYLGYFLAFVSQTPVDLKPLLDPTAPVDRRTYDRYGDE